MKKQKYIIYFIALAILTSFFFIVKAKTGLFSDKKPFVAKSAIKEKFLKRRVVANNGIPFPSDSYSTYMQLNQISLETGNGTGGSGILTLDNLTPTTVANVFGPPTSQTTEFSELDDANMTVYHYPDGNISFIGNQVAVIEGLDEGFSFQFNSPINGNPISMAVGSEADALYNYFPDSWENEQPDETPTGNKSVVTVFFQAPDGSTLDSSLSFVLTGDINSNQSLTIDKIIVNY